VAVPLYLSYVIEQSAFRKWCRGRLQASGQQITQAQATGAGGASSWHTLSNGTLGGSHSSSISGSTLRHRTAGSAAIPSSSFQWRQASTGTASASTSTSSNSHHRPAQDRLLLQVQRSQQQDGELLGGIFAQLSSIHSAFMRWCFHFLMVVVMLIVSWLISNAIALVLLPKVLSARQLNRWCPNQPYVPFLDAGLIYEGLL
jgi:hypothetical protein